jgi:hypothetical protein
MLLCLGGFGEFGSLAVPPLVEAPACLMTEFNDKLFWFPASGGERDCVGSLLIEEGLGKFSRFNLILASCVANSVFLCT